MLVGPSQAAVLWKVRMSRLFSRLIIMRQKFPNLDFSEPFDCLYDGLPLSFREKPALKHP